jgi:hypothetical protein
MYTPSPPTALELVVHACSTPCISSGADLLVRSCHSRGGASIRTPNAHAAKTCLVCPLLYLRLKLCSDGRSECAKAHREDDREPVRVLVADICWANIRLAARESGDVAR